MKAADVPAGTAARPTQRHLRAQTDEKRLRRGSAGSQAAGAQAEDALSGPPGRDAARPARPAPRLWAVGTQRLQSLGSRPSAATTALTCRQRRREEEEEGGSLTPEHLPQLTSAAPPSPPTERAPGRESRLVLPHRPPIPTQEGTPAH